VTAFAKALKASVAMRSLSDGGARSDLLLIILLEARNLFYGGRRRIELLVWNGRRVIGEARRRRLGLSVRLGNGYLGNGEKPRRRENRSAERPRRELHHCLLCAMHRSPENGDNTTRGRTSSYEGQFRLVGQRWDVQRTYRMRHPGVGIAPTAAKLAARQVSIVT
jgi:hypothetical protein